MKKGIKIALFILIPIIAVGAIIYIRIAPVRNLNKFPSYEGPTAFKWKMPENDPLKKTVIIMTDNEMTELFDFLTPFYLFNETKNTNVYIVAERKFPIITKNGPFVLPHFTYAEIDSFNISPELEENGTPPAYIAWKDTVNLKPRTKVKIAWVPETPGMWMYHCHILEHHEAGMMANFEVIDKSDLRHRS